MDDVRHHFQLPWGTSTTIRATGIAAAIRATEATTGATGATDVGSHGAAQVASGWGGDITATWSGVTYPLVICYIAIENGPFIVDLPIEDGDFPVRYVSLPEGNYCGYQPLSLIINHEWLIYVDILHHHQPSSLTRILISIKNTKWLVLLGLIPSGKLA